MSYNVVILTTLLWFMTNTPFSLRIDTDTRAKLKREAQQLKRSESYIATTAIKQYLDACEYKRQAIDEATRRADKGEFISSEAMNTWVDSWGTDNELAPPEIDIKINK